MLAPVGYSRLMHPGGEVAAARAAGEAGTAYVLSTISGHSLESVRGASSGPVCYQLYLVGGRAASESALERARKAGYSALVVTIDTPVAGLRERDYRNGMKELLSGSLLQRIPFAAQIALRPRWLASFLRDGGVPALPEHRRARPGSDAADGRDGALAQSAFVWEDLKWIRQSWPGLFAIKGVLTGDDARRAVDEGASAVIVSNHGGRQLDGVAASLRALPEIVEAVGDRAEVLMDGGVRRGGDIAKALCLGPARS